jgi:hypothetical protein
MFFVNFLLIIKSFKNRKMRKIKRVDGEKDQIEKEEKDRRINCLIGLDRTDVRRIL